MKRLIKALVCAGSVAFCSAANAIEIDFSEPLGPPSYPNPIHAESYVSSSFSIEEINFFGAVYGGAYVHNGSMEMAFEGSGITVTARQTDISLSNISFDAFIPNSSFPKFVQIEVFNFGNFKYLDNSYLNMGNADATYYFYADELERHTFDIQNAQAIRIGGWVGPFAIDNLSIEVSVPEPATWATMILGFLLLGSVLRHVTKPSGVAVVYFDRDFPRAVSGLMPRSSRCARLRRSGT